MEENVTVTPHFPTGKREIGMLIALAVVGMVLANCFFYGGANLGFAVTVTAVIIISQLYFLRHRKTGLYCKALTVLSVVIAASFARSDDSFVKFVMACFLLLAGNLSLVIAAGQNRRSPNGLLSLLDAPMGLFVFGVGELPMAFAGLNEARKNAGTAGKKNVAVLTGLVVAIPIVAVLIPLLISADAAFEGLIKLLPELDMAQIILSVLFGVPLGIVLYTRNTALKHKALRQADPWQPKTVNALTVNTVLIAVSAVYGVYLVSQLAYFAGGFSGILPAEFTMAEYARRGFFEMAWLTGINLGIIALAAALSRQEEGRAPLSTRLLCLFVGIVALFLTATASAKMFMYIDSYGLTRLRLLVQVIICFMALTVVFVLVWLFKPKFAYMKAVLLAALVMGAAVSWADVDTVVAAYNVSAYQSGKLDRVDVGYLSSLGDGVVPYLHALTGDDDPAISSYAKTSLMNLAQLPDNDIRGWNMAQSAARPILTAYKEEAEALAKTQEAMQKAAADFPLRELMIYGDASDAARSLIDYLPHLPHEGDSLLLYVKDAFLEFADGTPLIDVPVSYNTKYQISHSGVTSIVITSSYALFQSDEAPYGAMVWTERLNAVQEQLYEQFPGMTITHGRDNWYIMILPDGLG